MGDVEQDVNDHIRVELLVLVRVGQRTLERRHGDTVVGNMANGTGDLCGKKSIVESVALECEGVADVAEGRDKGSDSGSLFDVYPT